MRLWLAATARELFPENHGEGPTIHFILAYTAGVPLYAYFSHYSALQWALSMLGLAVFLVLYFLGSARRGPRLAGIIAAIFVLATLTTLVDPYSSSYYIYGAAFIAFTGDVRFAMRFLGGYLAAVALASWLLHFQIWSWGTALFFGATVGAMMIGIAEKRRSDSELRLAHDEVERLAKLAERERIGRDMHDVLGHTLSVIVLKAELAAKLGDRDMQRAVEEIRDVERIARESLAELRQVLTGYRAAGIVAEIDRAQNVLGAAGVRFECESQPILLEPLHENVLALAIREAVTNVVRHADARTCRVRLLQSPREFQLEIEDDGRGGAGIEGAGLSGMRARIEALGGTFSRDASRGTKLSVMIPLEKGDSP